MLSGANAGVHTMPVVKASDVSGFRKPAPPPRNTCAEDGPPVKSAGMPAAPQFLRMLSLVLLPQSMQGSRPSCEVKLDRLPRYSSYRPGARYELPLVARTRRAGTICQLRPAFQTLSRSSTES